MSVSGDADDYFDIGTWRLVSDTNTGFSWTQVKFTVTDGYQYVTRGGSSWGPWTSSLSFPTYVKIGDVDNDSGGFCMDDFYAVPNYSSSINITIGNASDAGKTSNYTAEFNSTVTNDFGTITNYGNPNIILT